MSPAPRWPVITALGIEQILAWGSSYYLLTILAPPISADTGWPLTWIIASLSAGLLVAGIVSPRVGRLIGRHGGRQVMGASAVLLEAGLLLLALAPNIQPSCSPGWCWAPASTTRRSPRSAGCTAPPRGPPLRP